MTAPERTKKNTWLLAVIPLALISLGILVSQFFWAKDDAANATENVYSIWITEAEIAPTETNQNRWDKDGSAPDPGALVTWQDQVVLETVVAKDSLIARWDPVAISIGDVILNKGGISTSSVKRIARIKDSREGNFSVALFDEDFIGRDFIGGWNIPTGQLRPGLLELKSGESLRRIVLAVTMNDSLDMPERKFTPKGAVYLNTPPKAMMETMERWAEEAKEEIEKLRETVSKGIDRLGKGVGESIEKLEERVGKEKDRLKEILKETGEKAGSKIKESLEKLLPDPE
ncbi:MAG: hypothetical protein VCA55_14250 [Verrucomicrobiales bacterium]